VDGHGRRAGGVLRSSVYLKATRKNSPVKLIVDGMAQCSSECPSLSVAVLSRLGHVIPDALCVARFLSFIHTHLIELLCSTVTRDIIEPREPGKSRLIKIEQPSSPADPAKRQIF
jgi:hypothetical protein